MIHRWLCFVDCFEICVELFTLVLRFVSFVLCVCFDLILLLMLFWVLV